MTGRELAGLEEDRLGGRTHAVDEDQAVKRARSSGEGDLAIGAREVADIAQKVGRLAVKAEDLLEVVVGLQVVLGDELGGLHEGRFVTVGARDGGEREHRGENRDVGLNLRLAHGAGNRRVDLEGFLAVSAEGDADFVAEDDVFHEDVAHAVAVGPRNIVGELLLGDREVMHVAINALEKRNVWIAGHTGSGN